MIVAISGIRELDPDSYEAVELAIAAELETASELRFGGALGTDSVALDAARRARRPRHCTQLRVFVPSKLDDQPEFARKIVLRCADHVVELGYPRGAKWAYLRRNDRMLDGAQRLVAFTDGREFGGTAYTIESARRLKLDVTVVRVRAYLR